jgi:hypothetical protein
MSQMTDDELLLHLETIDQWAVIQYAYEHLLGHLGDLIVVRMIATADSISRDMEESIRADILAALSSYTGRRFNGVTLVEPYDILAFFDIFMFYLTSN